MDNLIFSRARLILAGLTILVGIMLSIYLVDFWPDIYPATQKALVFAGLTVAGVVLVDGAEARTRSGLVAIIVMMALVWVGFALFPIWLLAKNMGHIFAYWRSYGYSPPVSFGVAWHVLQTLNSDQVMANWTCFAVGLPPIFALGGALIFAVNPHNRSRIAKSGPWTAGWMTGAGIRYLKSQPIGLPLGVKDGALLRYEPNPAKGWRGGHHLAIAGTRAGKGVSVVIPALVDHNGPVVCLDIKGENFAVTRRWRAAQGRRVVVLNPFSVIEPAADGFNPLDYIRTDYLVRDIDVVAEGLVRPESGAGSHFAEMAKQIVAAAIEVVMNQSDCAARNLNTVADLLLSPGFNDRAQSWADDPESYGRRPAQAAATILSAGDNERGGVMTTLKKAFEWARSDEMRAFLTQSTASFDSLLDDKIDVFVVVPLDQLDAQAVFMRLVINIVLGTVVRQDGRRTAKKRILLALDEFVRLGRMEKLLNIANVAAGSGIEALFITQDKGQIETVYGKNDTDSLLGSCVTTRIFGLGRLESNTAEWAATALGDQTVLAQSKQAATKWGDAARVSTSEQRQKLMTADQILELPADQMLCLIGSKPPLRLKALVSHAHRAYRSKLDPNPTRRA